MTVFSIDTERCKQDGLCAQECPMNVLRFVEGAYPALRKGKDTACIDCGHCVAVCPHNAITLSLHADEPRISIRKDLAITSDQAAQFLASRRSVRDFKQEELDPATLGTCLDLTCFAPSGHSARPVEWLVVNGREKVATVTGMIADWMREAVEKQPELAATLHIEGILKVYAKGRDIICRNAPALVMAHAPLCQVTPLEDSVIATSYFELAAHAHGIGTCWAGYVMFAAADHKPLRDYLGLADDRKVYGALMAGKPARRFFALPPRGRALVNYL